MGKKIVHRKNLVTYGGFCTLAKKSDSDIRPNHVSDR